MTPRFVVESARLAGPPLLRCQTDARLVDLVRAGNDRAFEAIVDRYRRPLLRYCSRLLPPARAEDAVQQAFLNAYGAMQHGDAELELRPWLYRIARNACLNALRENGWSHEQIEKLRRGTESAHEVAERRHELREVVQAMHTLPARQRDAVVLRELEGRTYDQIARELDSSEGAVRQLLNRARNTLRAGATALTPIAVLVRLTWAKSQPVVAQVSEAAGNEAMRSGAARFGGAAAAAVALAAGVAEAPHHLFGQSRLHQALRDPGSLPRLTSIAPAPPGGGGDPTAITLAAVPRLRAVAPVARPVVGRDRGSDTPRTTPSIPTYPSRQRSEGGSDTDGADRAHRPRRDRRQERKRSGELAERDDWHVARRDGDRRRDGGNRHTASIARHRRPPEGARGKSDGSGKQETDRRDHKGDRAKKQGTRRKGDKRKGDKRKGKKR